MAASSRAIWTTGAAWRWGFDVGLDQLWCIDVWSSPQGTALAQLQPADHGRYKLSVSTDFSTGFGHFTAKDMRDFAEAILAALPPA